MLRQGKSLSVLVAALASAAACTSVVGHPEFQRHIRESTGRNMDCAMCHSHSEGPDGLKPGQIGSLSPEDFELLAIARGAFEPGRDVESPILNEFGNHIIHKIGKTAFLGFRQQPGDLAEAIGFDSDLDEDGIADAQEYLDGTHPLLRDSGRPVKLFVHNLKESRFHILMLALATIFGLYGLNNLLRWFEQGTRSIEGATPDSAGDDKSGH